ncbi:NYN domain-containing protein [Pseudooceanicola sp. 502str34]
MRVPLVLFCAAVAVALAAVTQPSMADFLIPALAAALAALVLLVAALRDRLRRRPVLVDGSNVMHWRKGAPSVETLRAVLGLLRRQGYRPGIVFDANAGYKLADRYMDDREMAKVLGLPANRVLVVPRGEPADPTLLRAARDMGAPVVSNDRFRDWAQAHPEVSEPGALIRGGFRDGKPWLEPRQ